MHGMNGNGRDSGIPVLGQVPWGTHFCQFYQTREHLAEVLVPYFKAGLENDEFCVWVTSEAMTCEQARAALAAVVPDLAQREARGQIEIFPYTDWYLAGGAFDMNRILEGWRKKYQEGLDRGFAGLRVSGNTAWLESWHWDSFSEYEQSIDGAIEGANILVLCTYNLDRCGPYELLDVVRNHQFALVLGQRGWERIEHAELRRLRELQQATEARYRELFSAMNEGFALHEIVTDEGGRPVDYRFLDVNPAFERLTGRKRQDVVGRTVLEVLPNNDPFWLETYGKVALTGEAVHFENYASALDRHFEVFAYRPAPRRFAVVFMDVTQRKLAEEGLRRASEELARSNRELEQFAYIASHDLQEPLRMVNGFLGLLQMRHGDALGEEGAEYVRMATEGANRMAQLINDLLVYSRVQMRPLEPTATDLNAAFDQAAANCSASIEESQAQITRDHLPTVRVDPLQATQLLQNLIGNAVKFRRQGVRPEVHVSARLADGAWAVSVRDNGIGIEPTAYDRIFQPFRRLHSHQEYPGTGVGLAICKKIVERHGGRIWVESKAGEGATFCFSLPEDTAA